MRHFLNLIAPLVLLVACAPDDGDLPPQTGTAQVRVVNAIPGAGAVALTGADTSATAAFGDASPYVSIPVETENLSVAYSAAPLAPLASIAAKLTSDQPYTLAVTGALATPQSIGLRLYTDDFTPPAVGNVRVRLLHLVADLPTLGLAVLADSATVQVLDSTGAAYGAATAYTEIVASDTLRFVLTAPGDSLPLAGFLPLEIADLPPEPVLTVAVVGLADSAAPSQQFQWRVLFDRN